MKPGWLGSIVIAGLGLAVFGVVGARAQRLWSVEKVAPPPQEAPRREASRALASPSPERLPLPAKPPGEQILDEVRRVCQLFKEREFTAQQMAAELGTLDSAENPAMRIQPRNPLFSWVYVGRAWDERFEPIDRVHDVSLVLADPRQVTVSMLTKAFGKGVEAPDPVLNLGPIPLDFAWPEQPKGAVRCRFSTELRAGEDFGQDEDLLGEIYIYPEPAE